ncbi:hypothetical protein F8M41_023288 [Gigaspora margarita]|uniref:Uncharacterized protein n=1 Tax=Gigaspora margarita TaxID=4874 RepID=A0A8H4ETC6_GIGMA|nr:hypothetical protein F8M41_023288 [Gigaspora margarita]
MNRTPSTYKPIKKAFTISPLTHLERALNNPVLMPKMYFGPGVVTIEKQEFWHGELWQDSLLFGEYKIKRNNDKEIYKAGDFLTYYKQASLFMCRVRGVVMDEIDNNLYKLKVDRVLLHDDLPNICPTDNRHIHGSGKELWNVYHSLGGVYIQFGNMPLDFRKKLKTHFLISFVLFGATFDDFIKPVLQDIKRLESGLIMKTLIGDAWVMGGIGCITADLPQGNNLADVKRHSANHGCRTCNVPNDQYTNFNYNYVYNARFNQQTEDRFIEIEDQQFKTNKERLGVKYGLVKLGPLKILKWDQHIQTPQDTYHSMAGKIFKTPSYQNRNIKQLEYEKNLAVSRLCTCWTIEAKVLKLAFSLSMTKNSYQKLQELFESECKMLLQLFPNNFTNLPNLHVNLHLPQHARNFATLVNTSVGIKEMVHRIFKTMVPHTNRKAIELDLTRRYNTIQALRHLIDSWVDPRFNTQINAINNLAMDPNLHKILSGWYATEGLPVFINNQSGENENDNITIVCHDQNFIDISLSNKWNKSKVESIGLSKNLDVKHLFFQDLCNAYTNYLNSGAALINKRLEF